MNRTILPSQSIYSHFSGRASASASKRPSVAGSITLEAAMAVPLFFLAVVSLLYLMEIMVIQTSIRCGLQYAGKQAAKEAYPITVLMPSRLESNIIHAVGAERLERSIVE